MRGKTKACSEFYQELPGLNADIITALNLF